LIPAHRPDSALPSSRATTTGLYLLMVVLSLASLGQLAVIAGDYILPWSSRLWEIRRLPARDRSGLLYEWFGEEATEFAGFLRQTLPDSVSVIVPIDRAVGELRFPELWQYFLFPRRVVGCESAQLQQCLAGLDPDASFIVQVDSIPEATAVPGGFEYRRFGVHFGVFTPGPVE